MRGFDNGLTLTVQNLRERWGGADMATLRPMFRILSEGSLSVLEPRTLAERLAVGPSRVRGALSFDTVGTDEAGRLVELFGYMFAPSLHRLEVRGRAMFACCAIVAHSVPLLLEERVQVESVDPDSRAVVRMTIAGGEITEASPAGAVATFPASSGPWTSGDIRSDFCSHARHFADPETAWAFAGGDSRRRVLALDQMQEMAGEVCRVVWGL